MQVISEYVYLLSALFIAPERQISNQEWPVSAPCHRLAMQQHVLHGDWEGCVMPMHHHAHRISNHTYVYACSVHMHRCKAPPPKLCQSTGKSDAREYSKRDSSIQLQKLFDCLT